MTKYSTLRGEALDGAPAFTITVTDEELVALLLLTANAGEPLCLQHVGGYDFFLSKVTP